MDILFNLGISDSDLKFMLEQCPCIIDMDDNEINEKISILKYVGCNDRHIKNIIISNPYYLDRMTDDILKLIGYLKQLGFSSINLLFDSNPYLLNKDSFEVRDYVDEKLKKGMTLEDIIDEIDNKPYIIDED